MLDNIDTKQFLSNKLETEKFNIETVRVKKGFLIPFIIVITILVSQFGIQELLFNYIFYETSPVSMRGPLGGLTQVMIFVGIIGVFTLGFGTPEDYEGKKHGQYWRFVLFMPIVISVVQTVLLVFLYKYETPIYSIIVKNDEVEARKVLRQIYFEEDVPNIIKFIRESNQSSSGVNIQLFQFNFDLQSSSQSFAEALFGAQFWKSSWVGFFLQFFNQLSGINTVNLYSSKIFEQSGMDPKFGTFLVGVFNFLGAIIPMIIINRCGRKLLLSASFGFMAICHVLIVFGNYNQMSSFMTLMIIIYLVFYQLGAGPIPYIYITDICGDAGMSFGTLSMWMWSLFTTVVSPFLIMNDKIGITGTFAGLAVFTIIGFIFCALILRETKGLSDDECKRIFNTPQKQNETRK
eukprot:403358527